MKSSLKKTSEKIKEFTIESKIDINKITFDMSLSAFRPLYFHFLLI